MYMYSIDVNGSLPNYFSIDFFKLRSDFERGDLAYKLVANGLPPFRYVEEILFEATRIRVQRDPTKTFLSYCERIIRFVGCIYY